MTNYLKFDLSNVIGTAVGAADKAFRLLNGELTIALSVLATYRQARERELVNIVMEDPSLCEHAHGVEGYWLHLVRKDMVRAGHSEWVQKYVFDKLCEDN